MFLEIIDSKKNPFIKYVKGILIVIFFHFIGQIPLSLYLIFNKLNFENSENQIYVLSLIPPNLSLFLILIPFLITLPAIWFVVTKLHIQPFKIIITSKSKIDYQKIIFAFLLWGFISVIMIVSDYIIYSEDYKLNFDDTLTEPTVLPTKIPALLVNGASGIAVGMATNIAPHNLTEVIDGTLEYIKDNSVDINHLMNFVKAPDFPTGGIIHGYEGVKEAFHTGRGKVVVRGKAEIEELDGKESIIVTEIPYQVNKADMIKRIADLVNDKKLDGISTIRDESDRNGMRIVFVLKRDAIPNIVLNKLYKYSQLQSSFSVNSIALVNGRPMMLNLKDMIKHFVDHRHDVVVRRTKFELKKAEDRCHILEGLIIASDNIDEVISIIKHLKMLMMQRII